MTRWVPACVVVGSAVLSCSVGLGQGAPPTLEEQAEEIAAYAKQAIGQRHPGWPAAHREKWSAAIGEAVLENAPGPLSEAWVAWLKSYVDGAVASQYRVLAQESLPFQCAIAKWIVSDILACPLPTAEEVEGLKAQVGQWREYTEEQFTARVDAALKEAVGEEAEEVRAPIVEAIRQGCDEGEETGHKHIDRPNYRFDRVPLTDEEMVATWATLDAEIDKVMEGVSETIGKRTAPATEGGPRPDRWRQGLVAELVPRLEAYADIPILMARSEHWAWRHCPDALAEMRKQTGSASAVASETWHWMQRIRRSMLLLGGVMPETTGGLPGSAW